MGLIARVMASFSQIPWSTPWLAWGVLPIAMANLGYWLPMLFLEGLLTTKWAQSRLVEHHIFIKRRTKIEEDRRKVASLSEQIKSSAWALLGPNAFVNGALSAILLPACAGYTHEHLPSAMAMMWHLLLMELIGDLGLYWGHRIQHESDYLWRKFHSKHHSIGTPTAASTVYIDPVDATLQAGLPVILATALVRPHPLTYNVYIALRIGENVLNHSGLDSWVVDVLSLKFLPGRARIAHHDYHHYYSNYSRNAKNYGENFWLWDWAFGTLSKQAGKKRSKMNSKASSKTNSDATAAASPEGVDLSPRRVEAFPVGADDDVTSKKRD